VPLKKIKESTVVNLRAEIIRCSSWRYITALHDSRIFYRGGARIFLTLTIGGPEAAQIFENIEDVWIKKFIHNYYFPPFSAVETSRVDGFNRRTIGHGALAVKALLPVIPDKKVLPSP
jgi:polyribonucleotide nucleotidyltransferase